MDEKLGLRELSTCPRILSSVTRVVVTLDKPLNTISRLRPEKLQLQENNLNCLIVKLQRPQVLIFLSRLFFSALSQLYFLLLNSPTSQLPRV